MAIAHDFSSTAQVSGSSSLTWNHTVTGSNTYLVVSGFLNQTGVTITGITFNSVAMTLIDEYSPITGWSISAVNYHLSVYGLKNPASGTHSIAITGSSTADIAGVGESYTGVSQTSSTPDSHNKAAFNNINGAHTASTTTVADNCILVGAHLTRGDTYTAGSNTEVVSSIGGQLYSIDSPTAQTPAGSKSMTLTSTVGADSSIVIASLAPAPVTANGNFISFM